MFEDRSWIKVGAFVRECRPRASSEYTYITKVTASQFTLANGSRYSLKTMRKIGEPKDSYHAGSSVHGGPKEPESARWHVIHHVKFEAGRLELQAQRGEIDPSNALDAIGVALDEARAHLAAIDKVIADGAALAAEV